MIYNIHNIHMIHQIFMQYNNSRTKCYIDKKIYNINKQYMIYDI